MYDPPVPFGDANLVLVSSASQGPANRAGSRRSRPTNRPGGGREADRIKATRAGWASPADSVRTFWRTGPLPVPVAGFAAGVWAALTGLIATVVLTLVIWIFAAGDSASNTAMKAGADVWLAAHGTPFRVGTGTWSLMPWAWIVMPGILLWAAGRWVAHRAAIAHPKSLASAAGALAAGYALVALLAALFGTMTGAAAMPVRAFLHAGLLAFAVSAFAIAWRTGLGKQRIEQLWSAARPALGALATLVLGGAATLVVALLASQSLLGRTLDEIGAGLVGTVALFVAWLGYLPAALMWALSFVLGTGVDVAGVPVTPTSPLPQAVDFFGLELLPTTAQPWWLIGLLIPVAAGVVLTRLAPPAANAREWVTSRAVAVALLTIVVDVWWLVSTGEIGAGRLAVLGPSPLVIVVILAGIALGIVGEVGVRRLLRWWRNRSVIDLTDDEHAADDAEDVTA